MTTARELAERGKQYAAKYVADGWTFRYEPESLFIGANHSKGGKQSVLEMRFWPDQSGRHELGHFIAASLNSAEAAQPVPGAVTDEMAALAWEKYATPVTKAKAAPRSPLLPSRERSDGPAW